MQYKGMRACCTKYVASLAVMLQFPLTARKLPRFCLYLFICLLFIFIYLFMRYMYVYIFIYLFIQRFLPFTDLQHKQIHIYFFLHCGKATLQLQGTNLFFFLSSETKHKKEIRFITRNTSKELELKSILHVFRTSVFTQHGVTRTLHAQSKASRG